MGWLRYRVRWAQIAVVALAVSISPLYLADARTSQAKIVGNARVVDGDTIVIGGFPIRLEGIDAPETAQTCVGAKGDKWKCGITAAQRLASLIKGDEVTCEKSGEDAYKRTLAFCRLPDGTELNAWLVREGLALAFVRYSNRYVKDEADAKAAKRGVWAGTFQSPWDWRAENLKQFATTPSSPVGLLAQTTNNAKANCQIKGNINRKGERIYHVPGSKWYEKTDINEQGGERWFCTVTEAESAGWRAPRNRN